jgi:hypothetical protein
LILPTALSLFLLPVSTLLTSSVSVALGEETLLGLLKDRLGALLFADMAIILCLLLATLFAVWLLSCEETVLIVGGENGVD